MLFCCAGDFNLGLSSKENPCEWCNEFFAGCYILTILALKTDLAKLKSLNL